MAGIYNGAWTGPQIDEGIGKTTNLSNPNLLDNWYFVGGGSQLGGGKFPINQRGQTIYNPASGYTIDRWAIANATSVGSLTVNEDGITIAHSGTGYTQIGQKIDGWSELIGKRATVSAIINGTFYTSPLTLGSQGSQITFGAVGIFSTSGEHILLRVAGTSSAKIQAIKLELGDYQTLMHIESGVSTFNDIPDFGAEFIKCFSSSADSSDTFAGINPAGRSVLLWTNPNSTSSFAAQTLSLNLSRFTKVHIVYKGDTSDSGVSDFEMTIDGALHSIAIVTMPPANSTSVGLVRSFTPSSTGIVVADGLEKTLLNGTRSTNNAKIVPIKIYGVY